MATIPRRKEAELAPNATICSARIRLTMYACRVESSSRELDLEVDSSSTNNLVEKSGLMSIKHTCRSE